MKVSADSLVKALSLLSKAGAPNADIYVSKINSIERLVVKFQDANGDDVELQLAEADSGGFDYIERRERF